MKQEQLFAYRSLRRCILELVWEGFYKACAEAWAVAKPSHGQATPYFASQDVRCVSLWSIILSN